MSGFEKKWVTVRDSIIENWFSGSWDKVKRWAQKNRPEEYKVAEKKAFEERKKLTKSRKIKFIPLEYALHMFIDCLLKIIKFCYNIEVKNIRSGGTNKRTKEETRYCNFQGKLAELILYHGLPNKDDFNEIDLELYPKGQWDNFDILSKDGKINISVKSGLNFHQMLLLTTKDYNEKGEYRHHTGSEIVEKELFAFVRLNINRGEIIKAFSKSEDDFTKWFLEKYDIIEYDQFFCDICKIKDAIQNGQLSPKGNKLNENTPMDADNYYLSAYNMYQTFTELI